ncbi:MAG: DUF3572 domain-containing protein [Rhodobacterales bacterium]|nr:DUF3572 domain-containing protein [Rhodobacterales bacterium]
MQQESAYVLGLQALAWLAADPDRLHGFLASSGVDPTTLAAQAADPEFLGAVLDHLLQDDQTVMDFCNETGLPYTAPQAARSALPGGQAWHWT